MRRWRWPRAWRLARRLRRGDEPPGAGLGPEEHAVQATSPGLTEPGHYSSAARRGHGGREDHHRLSRVLRAVRRAQYTYNRIKQDNRNLLLGRDPTVDGMKTGYTEAAGYCLVASAVRDMPNGKRRLLSVVLGTASREARAAESQKMQRPDPLLAPLQLGGRSSAVDQVMEPKDSLIEYPSRFPIKVMGAQVEGFVEAIAHVARQFDPGFRCRHHRAAALQGRQLPGSDPHHHGDQPRAAR
jgi:hypothetical protein